MKSLFILLLASGLSHERQNVFLCKNDASETYHIKKNCKGIKGWSQDMVEVSLEEATGQYKKKGCKICCRELKFQIFPFPIFVPADGEDK